MSSEIQKKLESEGWQARFTASGIRLQEAVDNYNELGFEVKCILVRELDPDGCSECFKDPNDQTMMLFTRKR
jgi:hypothetical protein